MNEISVYSQLTSNTSECLAVIKHEIGLKSTCTPFAVKIIEAMKTLQIKTEQEALAAANTLLSGLQTLMQGGIIAEDYDKLDFVKRGKFIVPSARVEAFYRACARKGYRIIDTIVAVPKEDSDTTYFKEDFYNGDIIYILEDRRLNPDRKINAERLVEKYFDKFICRLDIFDIKKNQRTVMVACEISIDEMLKISNSSEQGLYKSKWEKYTDNWGNLKNRKIITTELNSGTFWVNWPGEMVNKTIIRRALKRIKEVLPDIGSAIYAFEHDDYEDFAPPVEPVIEIPVKNIDDVNLYKLTEEQKSECQEMFDVLCANPKFADDKLNEIKNMFDNGIAKQDIINKEYASIICLKKSPSKWKILEVYFNEKD